jgi:hypothetical protein
MLDAAWVRWAGSGSLSVRERRVCGKGNLASIGRTARHVRPDLPTPACFPGRPLLDLFAYLSRPGRPWPCPPCPCPMLHICRLFFLQSACGTPFLSTPPWPAIGTDATGALRQLPRADPIVSCTVAHRIHGTLALSASIASSLSPLASVTLVTRGCHARPLDALGCNGTPSMQQGASALDAFC